MLSLSDALSSRYLTFTSLRDAGIDPGRACLVTDILHGPEPVQDEPDDVIGDPLEWGPAEEPDAYIPDPVEYEWWLDQLDRIEALQAIRDHEREAEARPRRQGRPLRGGVD